MIPDVSSNWNKYEDKRRWIMLKIVSSDWNKSDDSRCYFHLETLVLWRLFSTVNVVCFYFSCVETLKFPDPQNFASPQILVNEFIHRWVHRCLFSKKNASKKWFERGKLRILNSPLYYGLDSNVFLTVVRKIQYHDSVWSSWDGGDFSSGFHAHSYRHDDEVSNDRKAPNDLLYPTT